MRRALWLFLVSGCATPQLGLHAARGASYDREVALEARCVTRGEDGKLAGDTRELVLGVRDGASVVAVGEVSISGRAKDYSFGQLCDGPSACADMIYLETPHARVWLEVQTTRPANDPLIFEEQLEEGRLITKAAALFTDKSRLAAFDRIARSHDDAASTRDSMLSILPMMETINDVRTGMSEASAAIETQMGFPALGQFIESHSVFLAGPPSYELHAFEVVRAICAAPKG